MVGGNGGGAWDQRGAVRLVGGQPVAHGLDHLAHLAAMRLDVHAGYVRQGLVVAVGFDVQDQDLSLPLPGRALQAQAQVGAQLERHVEPRQLGVAIQLDPRDVMDGKIALGDHPDDLGEPHCAAVAEVKGAARAISAGQEREADGPEQRLVVGVERAVDEDRARPRRLTLILRGHRRAWRWPLPRPS
jgi:hypothetical protein